MSLDTTPDQQSLHLLDQLTIKFSKVGQNVSGYLEGLLYADYPTYWDYIQQDTLLNIQKPATNFPDEMIFILYHQITELYFKLIIWELEQLTSVDKASEEFFLEKIKRINRYYTHLIGSFDITTEGMDREQFMKFRKALCPASGFQSIQYRQIELLATDLKNLVSPNFRSYNDQEQKTEDLFAKIYWKAGAIDMSSGQKDLTLLLFEKKYDSLLLGQAKTLSEKNIWQQFVRNFKNDELNQLIIAHLKELDMLANIQWPLAHYKSAVKHLVQNGDSVDSTGGTNWRKYLPPRFQKIVFFPELWADSEIEDWGKTFVIDMVKQSLT